MATNPQIELVIEDEETETKRCFTHSRLQGEGLVVQMAVSLSCLYVPDGETSTGQQKFRLYSDDEIIERTFALYDRLMSESVKRGYAVEIPPYEELKKKNSSIGFSSG